MSDAEKVAEAIVVDVLADMECPGLIKEIAQALRGTEAKGWAKGFREGRDAAKKDSKLTEARVWGEAICWLDEFQKRKLTIEELDFMLSHADGKVELQTDGSVLMSNPTVILLALTEFRRKVQEVKEG